MDPTIISILSLIITVLGCVGTVLFTVYRTGAQGQKVNDRIEVLEKLVPKEVDRLETIINDKFDMLLEIAKNSQEDIKRILSSRARR